ncbi:hypothetical protein AAFN60_03635 [Roseibacillus persicicus]|uniref:hypothetical protein n=1 Tax=Roseibacillus persicicus TaxID=454148 RepID=UPI00398A6909
MRLPHPPRKYLPRGARPSHAGGFSLIVTVTLLLLLSLIAIGLLSLSSTVVRSSRSDGSMAEARANARLGLLLALGELQRTMGPDTRISANGDILSSDGSVANGMRHVTGVWNAWDPNPSQIGSYQSHKKGAPIDDPVTRGGATLTRPDGGFHRWLVSSMSLQAASEVEFARKGSQGELVTLVPPAGQSRDTLVSAARVPLFNNKRQTKGQFAWVVLDEGQKAATNSAAPENPGFSALQTLATQSELAWRRVSEWSALDNLSAQQRQKLVTRSTLSLGGVGKVNESIHDLTPYSATVMSNTARGGLRTDLSLLLGSEELPPDYAHRHLYSDSDTPLMEAPDRGRHRYSWPSPDPQWQILHKFHRIPIDTFAGNRENPRLRFSMTANAARSSIPHRPNGFTGMRSDLKGAESYHNSLKLSPVISKAQFIFSLTFARGSGMANSNKNGFWDRDGGQAQSRWKAQVLMIIDPVITLWNPYDVPIDVSSFRIFLYRIPVAFQFNTSNPRIETPSEYTEYVMAIAPGANVNRNFAYPLNIVPEQGQRSIELLPGEHRVFSAQDYQSSWAIGMGSTEGKAVTMAPGWYPPGSGGRFAAKVGGISTENLYRGTGGQTTAFFKNKRGVRFPTAGLPVEANDQIRISVRPSSSEIGKFITAGNRAVDFYLRYGVDVPDSRIRGGNEQQDIPDFGAIELDYGDRIGDILRSYEAGTELPVFPIERDDILTAPMAGRHTSLDRNRQVRGTIKKKPFLVATLHLKSLVNDEFRSKFPAKAWIHNNPTAVYASAGSAGQMEDLAAQQYEFSYQPLQGDWLNGGFPEITGDRNQGYGGPSPGVEDGRVFAPFSSLPRSAPTSLAQFRHAPLNSSGKQPLQAQVIANSFAQPLLEPDQVIDHSNAYLDHSFLANQTLFDQVFFSGANTSDLYSRFLQGKTPLMQSRLQSLAKGTKVAEDFADLPNPYEEAAAHVLFNGAFNVNSTSRRAWQAFLTAMNHESIPQLESLNQGGLGTLTNSGKDSFTSRYQIPIEESLGDNLDPFGGGDERPAWTGHRRLTDQEIERLAANLVEEVKLRGPFQSLGEFINRRAEDSALANEGALQAAIDKSGLNDVPLRDTGLEIFADSGGQSGFANPNAAEGSSLVGTPGYLTQGDLLHSLAPALTARSDTFRIRGYGASTNKRGQIIAEAWCEAVVQRFPNYLDETNLPGDHPSRPDTNPLSEINERFGRRFRIISFRWLAAEELLAS